MRITDNELRALLTRAEELDRTGAPRPGADLAGLVGAAEEVGLSRLAMQRALAEQYGLPVLPLAPGVLVWARASDGKFYVAAVVTSGDETTRVRFLRGTEHDLALEELRSCDLSPGARVTCNWPHWGTWTCSVVAYDAEKERIKLNDGWGSTKWFPLHEVWMGKPRQISERRRLDAILIGAGAVLGSLLTALAFLI